MTATHPVVPHHLVREGAGVREGLPGGARITRAHAHSHACTGIYPSPKGKGYSSCEVELSKVCRFLLRARSLASGGLPGGWREE